jgi:hypothetical protein
MSYKHKNNKFNYYAKNYLRQLIPSSHYQKKLQTKLRTIDTLSKDEIEIVKRRVNYYNKLETPTSLKKHPKKLSELKINKGLKAYFFDLYEYGRFFNQDLEGHFLFGDITKVHEEPALVKTRPIANDNTNSVLLKWNKIRHFIYVKNHKTPFSQKKNMLVGRGKVHASQPHRIKFFEKYFGHPICNIGKVNDNELNSKWLVSRMTIDEQLKYKFILCLEGNDVASNLKWVMSSNSLAVMPKPRFESWFMEGLLIPDYHYIQIKDDYSDLESKIQYYSENTDKAISIIKNANKFVNQFRNKKHEDLISILVLDKYFKMTNQV